MSADRTPARQLLLHLEDEAAVADGPIAEVMASLEAYGVDIAATVGEIRRQADRPSPQRRPPPAPRPEPEVAPPPLRSFQPEDATGDAPEQASEPVADLMADVRIRPGGAGDIEKRKEGKRGSGLALLAALAVMVALAAGAVTVWPEILDVDLPAFIAGLETERQPAAPAAPQVAPAEPGSEVSVSRLEPVPPPTPAAPAAPPPEARPEPAPAPPPRAVEPAPAPQPAAPADPNAPLNIVPRVQAPVVEEARLPENVARPFTAPPSITVIVPVDRALLAEAGTGILSSGSRQTSAERRLAARSEDAERIAAGRPIAALVTLQSAEETYDAAILKRPRVDETRTIADADPALIPILGDTAHLFDLVRLPPQ